MIRGYREMYRTTWHGDNLGIINRLRHIPEVAVHQPTHRIHVLDLLPEGEVQPHVDHEKYVRYIDKKA